MVNSAVDLLFSESDIYMHGSLSVKYDFNKNYIIEFNSIGLLNFLKYYFPESLLGEKGDIIQQNLSQCRLYVI